MPPMMFAWEMLVRCGDPAVEAVGALWNPDTSSNGWFACPDNAAVDNQGRLWISTDQGDNWPRTGRSDGLFALETDGERRRTSKLFFRCPIGAELCGPCFTPDGETLFVAVQHPAADGVGGADRLRPRLDLQGPRDALAGLRSEDAAASVRARHHQGRRRQDRLSYLRRRT